MNRIRRWLSVRLSRRASMAEQEERSIGREHEPDEPAMSSDSQAGIDDQMPDIYSEAKGDTQAAEDTQADDDTQPELEIIESPSPASEESEGFDPYNTGGFKILKK